MYESIAFPTLGPLVALSLDKAVAIVVGRWPLMVTIFLMSVVGGLYGLLFAALPPILLAIYWSFAAYANAVRLERPAYRMTASRAWSLVGIYVGVGFVVEFGLLLFIVPGAYLGNKLSMASIVAAVDDVGVSAAMNRSWSLTDYGFWKTLAFNVVVWLAMMAVSAIGYIISAAVIAASYRWLSTLGGANAAPVNGDVSGVLGALAGFCLCGYVIGICLAYQAHAVAQLYWLRALEQRAAGAATSESATT